MRILVRSVIKFLQFRSSELRQHSAFRENLVVLSEFLDSKATLVPFYQVGLKVISECSTYGEDH